MANVNLQKTEQTDLYGFQQRAGSSLWTNSFKYAYIGEVSGESSTIDIATALPNSTKGERNALVVQMTTQDNQIAAGGAYQVVSVNFEAGEFGTTTALENLEKMTCCVNIVGDTTGAPAESPTHNCGQPTVMWNTATQLVLSRRNGQDTQGPGVANNSLIKCRYYIRLQERLKTTPSQMNPPPA